MPNPQAIVCDTDSLYQVFLANQPVLLRQLRDIYGIQPMVVAEIEMDVRRRPKLQKGMGAGFKKALGNGTLVLLDATQFNSMSGLTRNTTWADIQARGRRYNVWGGLGSGEAYTHAAAYSMGIPAMSNDWAAICLMTEKGLDRPSPILRTFDLLCLAHQINQLAIGPCEAFRSDLLSEKEHVPRAFQNASFAGGLPNFAPRIQCANHSTIGRANPSLSGMDMTIRIDPRR
jgi:hypothetical protein